MMATRAHAAVNSESFGKDYPESATAVAPDWATTSSAARRLTHGDQIVSHFRTILLALAALIAAATSPARADEGRITIQFFKAGWVIGGAYGKGILTFHG